MNNNVYGELLRDRYSDIYLSNSMCIVIGTIIGIFGNCVVIFFYLVRIKERGERYFIPLLAIVDLFACLTSSAFILMDNTFFYNYPNDTVCRILIFLQVFGTGFSANVLLVICVQRYLLVCKPFGTKMTLFWKKISLAAACSFSFVYSAPFLGISGIKTVDENFLNHTVQTTICKFSAVDTSAKITAYFGFLGLIILANIIITAALYIPVLRTIHISLSRKTMKRVFYNIQDGNTSSNTESASQPTKDSSIYSDTQLSVSNPTPHNRIEATKNDLEPNWECRKKKCANICYITEPSKEEVVKDTTLKDTVKSEEIVSTDNDIKLDGYSKRKSGSIKRRISVMFFVIILVYILSYIPSLTIVILSYAIDDSDFIDLTQSETIAWIYFERFVFLNHIANPFIYSYFDVKFRRKLKTFFTCKRIRTKS
ncbi:Hypothetical predicted protein [Mytilus galloprovincialis]|uniref:G-protein coupled receptors family 1 profile domain-containing protein n=1 Tax=Mytilus galloprovincialis TaxID=29158 RepID=A0A8B6GWF0_MYTGA|nr:Hypothetical predicted protein [Mytilus galloprovincialis]